MSLIRILGFLAALAGAAAAAEGATEHVCVSAPQGSYEGETIACYSDAGCMIAEKMGGEPVRGFDEASAPFALARGKIAAIVTSSHQLMRAVAKAGARCTPAGP